jgi:hypothetical protein
MKRISKTLATSVFLLNFVVPNAQANPTPIVESFTFTPNEVDTLNVDSKVTFEITVSHPDGIDNTSTFVTLSNSKSDTIGVNLYRTDTPANNKLTKVTFKGTLTVPRDINPGVYNVSAGEIRNSRLNKYQYSTGTIYPEKVRSLVGAEYGLLVRNNGKLELAYETFVGPTHDRTLNIDYVNPGVYAYGNTPLWKVGETYVPSKYYELRATTLSLGITSQTPTVCPSDGKELKFIQEGLCMYSVFTSKNNDYLAKISNQSVTITSARIKPQLVLGTIAPQIAKDLPKSLEIFRVYTPSVGYVFPQSETPGVCIGNGFYARIIGGGTCTLTYQSAATNTYLASDLYKVSFEVVREPQTITFAPSATANISGKSLSLAATASSGAAVTYSTTSTGICSITGSTLNLLKSGNCTVTATQAGTSTLAPVSATANITLTATVVAVKKTITCIKSKTTKKVTGTNPTCPIGYKLKK